MCVCASIQINAFWPSMKTNSWIKCDPEQNSIKCFCPKKKIEMLERFLFQSSVKKNESRVICIQLDQYYEI
jgi:histidinol phosphatase-like enzyme